MVWKRVCISEMVEIVAYIRFYFRLCMDSFELLIIFSGDSASFTLTAGVLDKTAADFDYEAVNRYDLTLTMVDDVAPNIINSVDIAVTVFVRI